MAVLRPVAALVACLALGVDAVAVERQHRSAEVLAVVEEKNRPVTKVITMLKDMLQQMQKEAEEDEEVWAKLACWCKTNDREKTQAIADAEERIDQLTTTIEETAALSAQLTAEIANLEKEVRANQEALDEATALRQKQLAEFNTEEKDLLGSINALKAAVTTLSKHNSFLQASVSHSVASSLRQVFVRHASLLDSTLKHKALSLLREPDYFNAEPTFKQSYAPQSGEIFGILTQMKETFETNLAQSQAEEKANQLAFEELKAAKEEEIRRGQEQLDAKTQTLANTDEKNAQSKQGLEDTRNSLAADEQFLSMLKEKCQMTDAEWEDRQKTRQQEMEAVSQALEVLAGDDAHDLFTRTFNPAFVQVESRSATRSQRAAAAKLLASTAERLHVPFLAALAVRVKLDAFTKVKEAINDMIETLAKEKADEIKHRDFCIDEFHKNQVQTEGKDVEKTDLIAEIEGLTMQIQGSTQSLEALQAEIAEDQAQLKKAGEDRETANQEFQMTVADQRATQKLLTQALEKLEDFYVKKKALLQQEPAGPPPPAGFKEYKKNASSGGVIDLIRQIIDDAKTLEAEVLRSEEEQQKAYEDYVKETNATVEAKSKEILNKSEEKAQAEVALAEASKNKEAAMLELEQLAKYNTELHQSCDFITKNFEVRQKARDEEVEALKQALAILSGANFS